MAYSSPSPDYFASKRFAAQFATTMGADVIFTSSSDEKIAQLKELGYEKFVNWKTTPEWDKEVHKLVRCPSLSLCRQAEERLTFCVSDEWARCISHH